ncbi:hypothetical protein [Sphingopyxis sp. P8]|uniref:hypothetical protein n=1 Tax=Sphingopyxis sp. P8 TaxID=2763256 RepID=UPI001D0B2EC0|nr:hypothetical protein [Sphingopyxis sp. P8]
MTPSLAAWLLVLASHQPSMPATATATATVAEAPTLAAFRGNWGGEGIAFGRPARATLAIGPADDGGMALAYRLVVEREPAIAYSAHADYRIDAKGRVRGRWSDSRGQMRPVTGILTSEGLSTHWGSADVEIGRSTYMLHSDDGLTVTDSVLQHDGSWRVFATLRYRKNP